MEVSANARLTSPTEIPILMYHHFTESETTTVSVERFKEQMLAIKNAGYNTITDDQLYRFLYYKKPLPEKLIMITMDDSYESNYIHAYPILKELGMKATIYIVVSDQEKTPGTIPHLTWEQTEEMYKSGVMDIQSHTFDSHRFNSLKRNY
ncbi:polysaccharide deacetylase family protein [Pseudalkalibacillus salsuginis]|uniref:polysaccharide deacetylase family protein n=1 Tax=Pseudalkalibacillus salsuginis TaxID=2910972 RepID=UPI001F37292F|nr:polysaccharide deacetylase family protein [Pseudalkalibacillus salsuginis]MCF6410089.1 polysaccharide deacetylase family protein [Pseudalkalibacillus salsuginis]